MVTCLIGFIIHLQPAYWHVSNYYWEIINCYLWFVQWIYFWVWIVCECPWEKHRIDICWQLVAFLVSNKRLELLDLWETFLLLWLATHWLQYIIDFWPEVNALGQMKQFIQWEKILMCLCFRHTQYFFWYFLYTSANNLVYLAYDRYRAVVVPLYYKDISK